MKIFLLGLLIFISFFISGCFSDFLGTPEIKLDMAHYDIGNISLSDGVWTGTFIVGNIGKGVLKISSVSTSCGCTEAWVEDDELVSEGVTGLVVTYDPSVHPGALGVFKRVVYIKSNDPVNKEIELVIVGNTVEVED